MLPADLVAALEKELACSFSRSVRAVAGGSIHNAARVDTSRGPLFLKYGSADRAVQFEAERDGVQALGRVGVVRTPQVLAAGFTETHAYIALEWLELRPSAAASDERLGQQLAHLHRASSERFGWHRDNFIGATPQRNAWCADWIEFWRRERLEPQLEWARLNGASTRLLSASERLLPRVADFFSGYMPAPSLIHGDLWSGNRACDEGGQPVIFDPAVYFADREAELAMCHLFGGFHSSFDRAYEREWPLAAGARTRRVLYQLYHVVNHFNLFGGSYHAQAERMIDGLLAETSG
jgi:protein-ribulosamine 3-kinase